MSDATKASAAASATASLLALAFAAALSPAFLESTFAAASATTMRIDFFGLPRLTAAFVADVADVLVAASDASSEADSAATDFFFLVLAALVVVIVASVIVSVLGFVLCLAGFFLTGGV